MLKSVLLKSWPHALAILVFVILASAYFSPVWDGNELRQGDIDQWRGMSKEATDFRMLHGEEALWTNSMFGGMPAYQVSTEHQSNLMRTVLSVMRLGLPGPVGTLFLAMLGFYIFGLCLRINPWISMLGAIAFGFSTINILFLGAGHTAKVNAIAFMAPTLGGMIMAFRGRILGGAAVFMLFLSLNITANHLQMTYYLALLCALVALGEIIRLLISGEFGSVVKTGAALGVAAVIAVLPSMSNLLTTYEYSKYTTRGTSELTILPDGSEKSASDKSGLETEYILQYNFAPGEQWSILIPNAKGGKSSLFADNKEALNELPRDQRGAVAMQSQYWGDQYFTGGAFYFGALMVALAILSLIFVRDALKWPLFIMALLAFALCLKSPGGLNDWFIHHFPMYNKFRDSKMIFSLVQVIIPALAVLFVNALVRDELTIQSRKWKLIGFTAPVIIVLALFISPSLSGPFLSSEERAVADSIEPGGEAVFLNLGSRMGVGEEQLVGLLSQGARVDETKIRSINVAPMFSVVQTDRETANQLIQALNGQELGEQLTLSVMPFDEFTDVLIAARESVFKSDAGRSLLFVILGVVVVIIISFRWVNPAYLVPVITVLALIDIWSVDQRYLNDKKQGNQYRSYVSVDEKLVPHEASESDNYILEKESASIPDFEDRSKELLEAMNNSGEFDNVKKRQRLVTASQFGALNLATDYRVLMLGDPFNDASVSYFHKSIGGYHGAKLKRYQELIDFHLRKEMNILTDSLRATRSASVLGDLPVINMLNTRYIVVNPDMPPLENPFACGNAWFADEVINVANADEEIVRLGEIDPRRQLVAASDQAALVQSAGSPDSTRSIQLVEYGVSTLKYTSSNSSSAPAVFSEIYYPQGWICRIDGNEVPYARVNYLLRAVMIPAGNHTIEWSFEPASFRTGSMVSLAGSSLLILLILGIGAFNVRKNLTSEVSPKS